MSLSARYDAVSFLVRDPSSSSSPSIYAPVAHTF